MHVTGFLLIVFVVNLHHQALISCGAKSYFSKFRYQLFLVQFFLKKIENYEFSIFFSFLVPKILHFFENVSYTLTLIWVGFLGVYFEVGRGGGGKLPPV